MDIFCIGEIEVCRADFYDRTQPANHVGSDRTYDIGMENDFSNDMGGSGYEEINSVLEIVEEISRETR